MACIKVDLDSKKDYLLEKFAKRLQMLCTVYNFESLHINESRHGYHIRLECAEKLKDYEILSMQLFLLSDYRREFFNLRRIKAGSRLWNVLFRNTEM